MEIIQATNNIKANWNRLIQDRAFTKGKLIAEVSINETTDPG
jgi:hypothetical protein